MSDLTTLELGKTTVDAAALDALAGRLRGAMLREGDASYDGARAVWNAMIDRRPGLIIRCAGASDVREAVRFARDNQLLVAVRGGGHNIGGSGVCDGGLMIDLSPMKSVRVDAAARHAWVEPGATLADVDKETQAFGLVVPTGINSTTGIAGLTLGGGFGWITRKFGLTLDNLIAADVVTAGDATSAMVAGRRAGAGLTVGVLSGAHRAAPLRAAGADAIVDSVADLPALLGLPS